MISPKPSTELEIQNIKNSVFYGQVSLKGRGKFNIIIQIFERGILHYRPGQEQPFDINVNYISREDAELWFDIYKHSECWPEVEICRENISTAS